MNRFKKSLVLISLTATSLCGFSFAVNFTIKDVVQTSAVTHVDNFDSYDWKNYSGNYYDSIPTSATEGMNGSLRTSLTDLILPKAWYRYSKTGSMSLSYVIQSADEDPTNSNNMIYLYTRDSVKKNGATTWNREHVWPQSLSNGNWGKEYAGTDILHIRPTYNDTNNKRDNNIYGNLSSGRVLYNEMPYGYCANGKFCPLDSVKGDVARIVMYLWVAYKDFYTNMPEITSVFESYDTLLQWHTLDEPDIMEANRNNFSELSVQYNRNPFVDHPEYAWKIFGEKCSASVTESCMNKYNRNQGEKELKKLTYNGTLSKTTYNIGEKFNPSGLNIIAKYNDGSSSDVTSSVQWSELVEGQTSVVGTYSEKGRTLSITVDGLTVKKGMANSTKYALIGIACGVVIAAGIVVVIVLVKKKKKSQN